MSLKSLLSARSQSKQLTHAFAKYDSSSKLSCSLCALPLKHESLWSSHLVSKLHRSKLAVSNKRAKEEEEERESKRIKITTDEDRAMQEEEEEEEEEETGGLPDDFYADKSEQPVMLKEVEEEEVEEEIIPEEDDDEWASFEAALAPSTSAIPLVTKTAIELTTNRVSATLKSAPVLYEFGAPVVLQEGEVDGNEEGEDDVEEETEDEKRERESREEREEMLERMDKEVRDQEEVDEKVVVSFTLFCLCECARTLLDLISASFNPNRNERY
jgi:zinc finger protein 830